MYYRFAATKEAIELNSIKFLQENKNLAIKKDNDFKGISFGLVWERLSDIEFKLICYHKGIFSIASEDFKELIEQEPFAVINTVLYKQLFSVTYISDSNSKPKDIVYTDPIIFKFVELFENDEIMFSYILELFSKIGWKIQFQDETSSSWQDYINF